MIRILGYKYYRTITLAGALAFVSMAAAAQDMLPVPGLEDQFGVQQAPAAAAQQQPVPAPSQSQLGMQQTQPPVTQTQAQDQTAQAVVPAQSQTPTPSASDVIDQMRARAQAERGSAPTEGNTQNTAAPAGNALPQVDNVRVNVEGMDYIADQSMNIEMRDTPLDPQSDEYQQSIRQEAFDAAANGMFPLRTDEIKEIMRRYDETRKAVETPHYELPTPEVKVETVSLDPGVTPPVINTAVGHVTTLTVLDVTGAPWPIQDVTWAGDFEVIEPEEGGHIIRITPMANFAYGNVSMRLLTLKTPITFTLRTGRESVQYRFDARIPEYGPMAEAPLIDGGKQIVAGDKVLTQILDGVTPTDAEKLDVSGVDGRTTAILIGGTTYLRTPLTLLSPAWDSSVKSADGMHVYAMAETPVVLLSDGGKFRRATLRVREGFLDE